MTTTAMLEAASLRVTLFEPSDLRAIAPDAREVQAGGQVARLGVQAKNSGPAFTLRTQAGDMVACVGLMRKDDGSAFAWSTTTALIYLHVPSFYRTVKRGLEALIREYRYPSIWTVVDEEYLAARNFLEHLEFDLDDPPIRSEGDGKTYLRYRRTGDV